MGARARKKVMVYHPDKKCLALVHMTLNEYQAKFDVLLGKKDLEEAALVICLAPSPPWISGVPVIEIAPEEITGGAPLLEWLKGGGNKSFWPKMEELYHRKLINQAIEEENHEVFYHLLNEIQNPVIKDKLIAQAAKCWKVRVGSIRQALKFAQEKTSTTATVKLEPGFNYLDGKVSLPVVVGEEVKVAVYDPMNLQRLESINGYRIEPPPNMGLITKLGVPGWGVQAWAKGEVKASWTKAWEMAHSILTYYVEFLNPVQAYIVTSWAIATYFYKLIPYFPYLHLGGEPNSGKSKTLTVLRYMAFQPTFIAAPTAASVFRLIDGLRGTVLIDEVEALGADFAQGLVTILNVGFDAGRGVVVRTEKNGEKYEVCAYNVYGPKALASVSGLVKQALRALRSRVIEVVLIQASGPQGQRDVVDNEQFKILRTHLYAIAFEKRHEFAEVYAQERQKLPNRVSAKWAPLLAVALLAAPEGVYEAIWAEAIREAQTPLDPLIIPTLEALDVLLRQHGTDEVEVRSRDIANLIGEEDATGRLTRRIARRLSNVGFTYKVIKGSRRFIITKAHLDKIKERFAVHPTPQPKQPKPPHNSKIALEANLSGVTYPKGKTTPKSPQADKQPQQGGLSEESGLRVAYERQKATPPKQATQANLGEEGGLGDLTLGYEEEGKNLGRAGPGKEGVSGPLSSPSTSDPLPDQEEVKEWEW